MWRSSSAAFRWLELHPATGLDPDAALQALRQLSADQRSPLVALELRATSKRRRWFVGANEADLPVIRGQVAGALPDVIMSDSDEKRPRVAIARRLKSTSWHRALVGDRAPNVAVALRIATTDLRDGEQVVMQLLLGPRRVPLAIPSTATSDLVDPIWRTAWYGSDRRLDSEQRSALRDKVSDHGFAATLRLGVTARTGWRRRTLVLSTFNALRLAEGPGVHLQLANDRPDNLTLARAPWRWPLRINVSEALALCGWPLGEGALGATTVSRLLPADKRIRDVTRVIGDGAAPGDQRPIGLSAQDARHHVHIMGGTGTGKTTLALNLICQDVAAGSGLVVVDPKGDLVQDVLARIPANRAADVVVLDPLDKDSPVGLNPLAGDAGLAADLILSIFHSLFDLGPRTQDVLNASLLTLGRRRDANICLLPLLLTNPGFRRSLTSGINDPVALGPFWAWYEGLSEAERGQVIGPVMNKLRAFLLRPAMRAVLGQGQPRFDISQVFTERKIFLVSLAKGELGSESAALLGSLVVSQLWRATQERVKVAPERRHVVPVYLDEFQNVLHLPTDLGEVLEQARGFGLALHLAHQHLAQLTPRIKASVMANARSKLIFNLDADDAVVMAQRSSQLTAEDFQRLGKYELYARLLAANEATDYASLRTRPAPAICSSPDELRRLSRERYGQPLSETEAGFIELLDGSTTETRLGRSTRRPS